jgi:hypothetical protein
MPTLSSSLQSMRVPLAAGSLRVESWLALRGMGWEGHTLSQIHTIAILILIEIRTGYP